MRSLPSCFSPGIALAVLLLLPGSAKASMYGESIVELTVRSDLVLICDVTRTANQTDPNKCSLIVTDIPKGSKEYLGMNLGTVDCAAYEHLAPPGRLVFWRDITPDGLTGLLGNRDFVSYGSVQTEIDAAVRVMANPRQAALAPIRPLESNILYKWILRAWFEPVPYWQGPYRFKSPAPQLPLSRKETAEFLVRLAYAALDDWPGVLKNKNWVVPDNDPRREELLLNRQYALPVRDIMAILDLFKYPGAIEVALRAARKGEFDAAAPELVRRKHPMALAYLSMALDLPLLGTDSGPPYDLYTKDELLEVLTNIAGEAVTEEDIRIIRKIPAQEWKDRHYALDSFLRHPHRYQADEALAELGDPRAVPVLLRAYWRGEDVEKSLLRFDDPRIKQEALDRMTLHPNAPRLLAALDAPEVKPLLEKMIQQGFKDRWLLEKSAKSAGTAVEKIPLECSDGEYVNRLCDRDRRNGSLLYYSREEMGRLCSVLGIEMPSDHMAPGYRSRIAKGLLERAEELNLSREIRSWLKKAQKYRGAGESIALLPNYPQWKHGSDYLYRDEAEDQNYMNQNGQAVIKVLLDPCTSVGDIHTILEDMIRIPDIPLTKRHLHELILRSDVGLNADVYKLLNKLQLKLDRSEMRRIVNQSDPQYFLHYTVAHPTDVPSIYIAELFNRDNLLSRDELFVALRAVKPDGVIPRLKSLLVENHINVRRNAALTLAAYGDASGVEVLRMEYDRLSCGSSRSGNGELKEVKSALESLHALN